MMVFSLTKVSNPFQATHWQWQTWKNLPYLTCNLLASWPHGFFTAPFYPSSPEVLTSILAPSAQPYRLKQVHGNQVVTPSLIVSQALDNDFLEADALISDGSQQALWVASADCTPVLIGDQVTRQVAAIHAGWRGTAQRIVPKVIEQFLKAETQKADLRIAMGPAIKGEVYQMSKVVAAEVGKSLFENQPINSIEAILDTLQEMFESPIYPDSEEGKIRLDVRRINELQLQQLGFSREQIAIAPYCTYQNPELFFSYRRTHEKKVQWSAIVS